MAVEEGSRVELLSVKIPRFSRPVDETPVSTLQNGGESTFNSLLRSVKGL